MTRSRFAYLFESDDEYSEAVSFWNAVIEELAISLNQADEWVSWGNREFLDGSPVPRDMLPIVQKRSSRLSRSIQILQGPPTKDSVEIGAWVQSLRFFKEPEQFWEYTDELVINLALSDPAEVIARQLLACWMEGGISRERMEDLIPEILDAN